MVVTADETISQVLTDAVDASEWNLVVFNDPAHVFSAPLEDIALLLLDDKTVPGGHYMAVVKRIRKRYPSVDIVVVGGPKADDVQLTDRREGVDYYYERPIERTPFASALEHRLELARLKAEAGIVGRSPQIEEILEAILQVAPTEVPILIEGESGSGKDVVARAVHSMSRRRDHPYVAINVASLAEGVLESELFGHEKGAFTGAVAQRPGVFERANGGTIFLDEVGEMSPSMQVRLLRVLESGEVLRVGGVKTLKVDVRVVAATNRNLGEAVASGSFRQDLYYRLKGVSFYVPPLRERKDDIPVLVNYFVRKANDKHNKNVKGVDAAAMRRLVDNYWPGNIRELRNVIDTTVVLAPHGRITVELVESQLADDRPASEVLLPVPLHRSAGEAEREMIYASLLALRQDVREIMALLHQLIQGGPLQPMREVQTESGGDSGHVRNLAHIERTAILNALRATNGNRRRASEMLGISERTLYRKIKEYGLV